MQGDEDAWLANTKKFTEATGVEVRVDKESWEDIRPKAAVTANVGSGPDMVLCWFDDAHQYPDKLVDLTDLGTYLDGKYGGFYDGLKGYAMRGDKYIALPLAAIGNAICYRQSHIEAAGFKEFPKDTAGFLDLCKAMKAKGTPAGFAHGKAVGDGNNYAHWLLWSHGGKMVDETGVVASTAPRRSPPSTMPSRSTRPSFRARKAGRTSTTTAPSWRARCRSRPTASRSITPPKRTRS